LIKSNHKPKTQNTRKSKQQVVFGQMFSKTWRFTQWEYRSTYALTTAVKCSREYVQFTFFIFQKTSPVLQN